MERAPPTLELNCGKHSPITASVYRGPRAVDERSCTRALLRGDVVLRAIAPLRDRMRCLLAQWRARLWCEHSRVHAPNLYSFMNYVWARS
eukprot:472280-Prymnesium_polylepis.1